MELIGQRFGHIRVTGVIGQGGMGDVYAGYDEKLERTVALKVLNADQRLDQDARERLLREARALSRLDHPNICRIYDYLESDNVDLLVLELIDGTTLADVKTEGFSRGEKLRIASAIASVLVAAHRADIVHRDLKPENVMITKSGEVKVLDFGLARWLKLARGGRSSDRHAAVVPIAQARGGADTTYPYDTAAPKGTAVGVTLGTPLYMSPEQARGDTLTPASDMFSFGLVLQSLFTGNEPHPIGLSAREVILRVSSGETNPVTGVDHDVAALIGRLKQIAPPDRPTAVEAVERLKHMTLKPQRLARRGIAIALAAVATIGVWRYTVDLQRERAKAVAAQVEAEKRRAQAEDLINFMVGDLRTKLEPVGALVVLDDVAKKTLKYVSDLDPARMSTGELIRNSKVLNQLGEVQIRLGDPPAALPLFERSLSLSQMARTRDPRDPEAQLAYGFSQFWIGDVRRQQKELPAALTSMREYLNVTEKLAREHPANAEYQLERTRGHNAVGVILEAQGDLRGALDHYKVSLDARTEEARRKPDDPALQADLARALNKVGTIQHKLGDLPGARDYFRREVETYRTLVAADPKQTQWRQRMAVSLGYLALMHWHMGDVDGAFALWREELAMERELAARDPANVTWQRNVFVTMRRIANVHEARDEFAPALETLAAARAGLQGVQRRAPNERTVAKYIAYVNIDYGRVLAETGSSTRAKTILLDSIAALEPLSDRESQVQLARTAYTLSEIVEPARAEASLRRAEQLLEPLVASSGDIGELDAWSRVLARRGRCDEARRVVTHLSGTRYDVRSLERVLSQNGCR